MPELLEGLDDLPQPLYTRHEGRDRGVRFRDVLNTGQTNLLVGNPDQNAVYAWTAQEQRWERPGWGELPADARFVDEQGRDAGLRFADLNQDGYDDVIFSDADRFAVYLMVPSPHALRAFDMGWVRAVRLGERGGTAEEVPMIVRDGPRRDNGVWFNGHPLRAPDGTDNGVRLLDVTNNGYMDVVVGNEETRVTRIWDPDSESWNEVDFPVPVNAGTQFGVLREDGAASVLIRSDQHVGLWHFENGAWVEHEAGLDGLPDDLFTKRYGVDRGVRLRDLDGNGICELIVANDERRAVYRWRSEGGWEPTPAHLPDEARIADGAGRDGGLRFVDVTGSGDDDLILSNDHHFGLYYYRDLEQGWEPSGLVGTRGELENEIPRIVRHGMNNGVWFDDERMWMQNEDTGHMHHHAQIIAFDELMEWADQAGQENTD